MNNLKKNYLVAQKMESAAEAYEEKSSLEAQDKLLSNWIDHFRSHCVLDDFESDDAQFDIEKESECLQSEVLVALSERCRDFDVGYCRPFDELFRKQLSVFLTFSFCYRYDEYFWNHKKSDPNDENSFFTFESTDSLYPYVNWQHLIVITFKEYLTKAAALAKKIGSSSYPFWRDALVEVVFDLNSFENDVSAELVNRNFDKISRAAQILWADVRIDNQMTKLTLSPTGYKGKKAKKRLK